MGFRPKLRHASALSGRRRGDDGDPDGTTMRLVKQAAVVVGLLSGIVGLVFGVFPQIAPQRHAPPAEQSAVVRDVVTNGHTTQAQYLDYDDRSRQGFTRDQLSAIGASMFARVRIVGYRGKTLILERQVIDARSGDVVGTTRDYRVTPPADHVDHRWGEWTPLRRGRGRYVMVIKLLDQERTSTIACGQSAPFGGRDGTAPGFTPRLCAP